MDKMTLEEREFYYKLLMGLFSLSIEELQVLCFEMKLDWEELVGWTKGSKINSLIVHLAKRGQLTDLLTLLRKERPDVDWPVTPPALAPRPVEDYWWLVTFNLMDGLDSTVRKVVGELARYKSISVSDTPLQEILHLHYPEVWTDIIQRGLYKKKLDLSDLLRKIRDYFDESEFRDICFTLEISYGQLGGEHYYDKARELVSHCKRNGKLNDLIKLCKEQRPFIIWDYE